ncbi:hypothetical protein WJX81_001164 [Elliptochloris bilobata]|uniref:RNA polymerase-associated protein LEO1 n=1 Tax=Elliptochloris bilobata TaxID=381761 RepID=A0AAW1R2Z0_9CHLO
MEPLDSRNVKVAKLSNLLCIDSAPYDPATSEPSKEEEYVDEEGKQRVRIRNQNPIRWRLRALPDGSTVRESNARFIRWSDGSLQLQIGDEVLDVAEHSVQNDHSFLFIRHSQIIQGQAAILTKMVFRPASLNAKFHRRLVEAVEKRHVKAVRVRQVTTMDDPARAKADKEREEEARIRERETLERKQTREMRRYAGPARWEAGRGGSGGGAVLSERYLEALEEEPDEDEDLGISASERFRNQLHRPRAQDDAEAERRLASAKRERPPPAAAPPPPKRRTAVLEDDSDGEDGGLAVDDDDDDDEGFGDWRGAGARRGGIVLSDDED